MIADRSRSKRTPVTPLKQVAARLQALTPGRLKRGLLRSGRPAGAAAAAGGGAATTAGARRAAARPRRPAPAHARRRVRRGRRGLPPRARLAVAVLVLVVGLMSGGWLWFRDSSLVAVKQVAVAGASGPDAGEITGALTAAARRMTTMDVDLGGLRRAVARYPVVADLKVHTQFPHRIRIEVLERIAVGTATVNGRQTAVSGDGMLLVDVPVSASLPVLSAGGSMRDGHLAGAQAKDEVAVLGAAPSQLIPKISGVSIDSTHGLTAQLRGGPALYFGDAGDLAAKWIAATAVLADPGSAGAAYIDVTDAHRPAAGVGSGQAASAAGAQTTAGSQATAATATPQTSPSAAAGQGTPGAGTVSTGASTTAATSGSSAAGTVPAGTAPTAGSGGSTSGSSAANGASTGGTAPSSTGG